MNRQQQRKLKKHPLIRAIRGIFRLLRVIFRPARSVHPVIDPIAIERVERERARIAQAERDRITQAKREQELAERYITVGALLERVQWKFPEPIILDIPLATQLDIRPQDVSRN